MLLNFVKEIFKSGEDEIEFKILGKLSCSVIVKFVNFGHFCSKSKLVN